LRGRENIDQAVDRRGCVLRVQSGEDEVAGLGRGNGGRDRLEVAHLAEEDHVRVLAKRTAQGVGEADGVGPDLALIDDASLVAVQELDRVLDGHDVVVASSVDLVDHGRESRRLTGARGTGYEDEAARFLRKLVELRRQPEILERLQLGGNHAEGTAETLALEIDVDAKAREAWDRVGDVDLAVDLQVFLLLGREDAVKQPLGVVSREARELLEPLEAAVQADDRMRADREVQVGRAESDHRLEQVVDRVCRRRFGARIIHWGSLRPVLSAEKRLV
jgi:hypothetical protein